MVQVHGHDKACRSTVKLNVGVCRIRMHTLVDNRLIGRGFTSSQLAFPFSFPLILAQACWPFRRRDIGGRLQFRAFFRSIVSDRRIRNHEVKFKRSRDNFSADGVGKFS